MVNKSSIQPSFPIPIFCGEKYEFWSIKMKTYLKSQKLWDIIHSQASTSADTSTMQDDAGALFILQSAVDDTIFPLIAKAATAKEAWNILEKKYKTKMSQYERVVDKRPEALSSTEDQRTRRRRLSLYRAALDGNWKVAKDIYDVHKDDIRVPITYREDTVLHVAVAAKRIEFVKKLVRIMNPEDLAKQNKAVSTALFYAAASGSVELAMETTKGNKEIAMTKDVTGTLPIIRAASLGHKDMVKYLFAQTGRFLKDENCIELLVRLIETDWYDVAMRLLWHRPQLKTQRAGNDETALHVLARKNLTTPKRGIFRRCFNLGEKDEENKEAMELVEQLWGSVILLSDSAITELINTPEPLIIDAAKHGNVSFLRILIREYPDLLWKMDKNGYSIFHNAVLYRLDDLFKLVHEKDSTKDTILYTLDEQGNNILHLAGKLPTQDRLDVVSGAALQMQRELLWFQEVKNVVPQWFGEAKNKAGLTPRELFSKEHKELKEKGEIWMKDTASSCMIVATLIATVVFAAVLTVPGGNKDGTGLPFFLQTLSFKIFAVADVISLVSSSVSIIHFLSIVAPRYAEKDFLRLLPRKLIIGLATLFISIAAMMVVFSATTFILFKDGSLWIAILAIVIASIPVIVFIRQHFLLFYDVLRSPFASNYFSLFCKEGERSKHQKKKTRPFNGP